MLVDHNDSWDYIDEATESFYTDIKKSIMAIEHNFVPSNGDWTVHNIEETKRAVVNMIKSSKNYVYEADDGYSYFYNFEAVTKEQLADNFGDAFWCLIEGEK